MLLREALFTSESVKLGHVRPFVRPSVRIIIDFCEGDMKGAETLLDTGSLNYGFWWFWKKTEKKPSKTRINERDMVVQGPGFGPGFDHGLGTFFQNVIFWK